MVKPKKRGQSKRATLALLRDELAAEPETGAEAAAVAADGVVDQPPGVPATADNPQDPGDTGADAPPTIIRGSAGSGEGMAAPQPAVTADSTRPPPIAQTPPSPSPRRGQQVLYARDLQEQRDFLRAELGTTGASLLRRAFDESDDLAQQRDQLLAVLAENAARTNELLMALHLSTQATHASAAAVQQSAEATEAAAQRAATDAATQRAQAATASTTSRATEPFRLKPKGEMFNGDRDKLRLWLLSTEEDFRVTHQRTDDDKIAFAGTFLSEAARSWFLSLRATNAVPHTWAAFSAAITAQFTPVGSQHRLREEMGNLVQKTTVVAYIHAFQQLALQMVDLDPTSALVHFLRGLRADVRVPVHMFSPPDVATAMRLAQSTEDALATSRPRPTSTPATVAAMAARPAASATALEGAATRVKLSARERWDLRQAGCCFKCRQPGHIAADCPERAALAPTTPAPATAAPAPPAGNGARR